MTTTNDVWALTSKAYEVLDQADPFEFDVMDIADELTSLLLKKQKDYGPKNISQAPGGALNGLRVRMYDKIARINHLIETGATPENESLEDSFKDLANYSIIALMVMRGKWPQ